MSAGIDETLVAHLPIEYIDDGFALEIHLPISPAKEKAKNSLVVDIAQVDLGRIELGDARDCYYIVTNAASKRLKYYTTVNSAAKDLVGKLEYRGSFNPHEVKQVILSIKPKLGRGLVSLRVRSSDFSDETIVVKYIFFAVLPGCLEFSTLGDTDCQLMRDPAVSSAWELDLKYCFLDQKQKYSKLCLYTSRISPRQVATLQFIQRNSAMCLLCRPSTRDSARSRWAFHTTRGKFLCLFSITVKFWNDHYIQRN